MTGSKFDDGIFSLSHSEKRLEKGSPDIAGLVGVRGMSSETSDNDVAVLIGVLMVEAGDRVGVTGKGDSTSRTKRPPFR